MNPVAGALDPALVARLRALRPFNVLDEAQFARVLDSVRVESARAGDTIIQQNDGGRDYLVLLDGELEVSRRYLADGGAEEMQVGRLLPGQGAGEMALLHCVPRQASVRALCDSRYVHIDGERMDELLAWSQCFADELRGLAELRARMNLVRQTGPFRRLPLENVQRAFAAMQPVEFAAGESVVRQGEPGDRYYIIEQGTAEVWQTDPFTEETACVNRLGPGDAFGEEALLVGGYRNATVTLTTAGRLWALAHADFDALVKPELVEEVNAAKARELADRQGARWLDCRYDVEYEEARIPGARLFPLDRLRELVGTLDKTQPYIVYCRSGRRSAAAAYLLRERGYQAWSLAGGIRDWPFAMEGA